MVTLGVGLLGSVDVLAYLGACLSWFSLFSCCFGDLVCYLRFPLFVLVLFIVFAPVCWLVCLFALGWVLCMVFLVCCFFGFVLIIGDVGAAVALV